jgi:hypothetical protein
VLSILIPTISLVGVLTGAILQYSFSRRLEAGKQMAAQRAQCYIDFCEAFTKTVIDRSPEHMNSVTNTKLRICVYGSRAVVERMADFLCAGGVSNTPAGQAAFLEMVKTMRRDVVKERELPRDRDFLLSLYEIGVPKP